jgi:hypothetical protein
VQIIEHHNQAVVTGHGAQNFDGALEETEARRFHPKYRSAISEPRAGHSDGPTRLEGEARPQHLCPGPERRYAVVLPASPPRDWTRRAAQRFANEARLADASLSGD